MDFFSTRKGAHPKSPTLIVAFIAFLAQLAIADPPASSEWIDSLDAGYMQSQVNNRPMFVLIGSDRVETSRQLWQALRRPPWTDRLQKWTAIRLDSDSISPAVRSLGVVGAPAVRLLAADGKQLAGHDAFTSVDEFVDWMNDQDKRQAAGAVVVAAAPVDVATLLRDMGDGNVAVREAAVRQLRGMPAAAPRLIDAVSNGSLSQRLSAADLLEQWGAPTAGIDPWQPKSVTLPRLAALNGWAKSFAKAKPSPAAVAPSVGDELDSLLLAPTEIQARAVRQRLVKFRESILPQVYDRLKKNTREPNRHRLVALRYRLVATDALAMDWPGGFDRLASADPEVRRAAATDLANHAKPEDHRLLSELFADEDPFVRAQSLKLLRTIGGPETNRELIKLLADPEPNVRAAVLDSFAETPDPAVVPDLLKYVGVEKDADLVVHVVHVLQETPGADAFEALRGMLKHPQWRVRGEAAESLRGKLTGRESDGVTDDQKASATNALVKLLDDPDGYVVTRAAGTLIKSAFAVSARALMKRVAKRPELARDVLKAIADDSSQGPEFLPQIRELTASTQPSIRSAAVTAAASIAPGDCGDVLVKAIRDPDVLVREAGLHGAQLALAQLLPSNAATASSNPITGSLSGKEATTPTTDWISKFRDGAGRPPWLNELQPDVVKALTVDSTCVPAATILCALGKDDQALPVLMKVNRGEVNDAAAALVWLPWESKLPLFKSLLALVGVDKGSAVIAEFTKVPDPRVADELWGLLGAGAPPANFEPVHEALQKYYLGENYYNAQNLPQEQKDPLIAVMVKHAKEGVDMQRSSALAMLLSLAPDRAAESARVVRDDPHATEWGRLDALQIELLALPADTATPIAVAALTDPPMRKVAVPFLAAGPSEIRQLRGSIYLSYSSNSSWTSGQPIPVLTPAGLDSEASKSALREMLGDNNAQMAGYAAYLLGISGDRSGFDKLVATWRANDQTDPWSRMLYRVITKNNDDAQTPLLEEIYRGYVKESNYQIREMYWTIRSMTGPNILKLRKTIRDEYGMSNLE